MTRFNRHFPRLCGSCGAPMARQEDSCWRCGVVWGEVLKDRPEPPSVVAAAAPVIARDTLSLSELDTDRWMNEGGSVTSEAPLRALVTTVSQA